LPYFKAKVLNFFCTRDTIILHRVIAMGYITI